MTYVSKQVTEKNYKPHLRTVTTLHSPNQTNAPSAAAQSQTAIHKAIKSKQYCRTLQSRMLLLHCSFIRNNVERILPPFCKVEQIKHILKFGNKSLSKQWCGQLCRKSPMSSNVSSSVEIVFFCILINYAMHANGRQSCQVLSKLLQRFRLHEGRNLPFSYAQRFGLYNRLWLKPKL